MTNGFGKIITAFFLLAFSASAAQNRQNGVLYRVALDADRAKTIAVVQSGKKLMLRLEGFGKTALLAANAGGTETCRTIIEHRSDAGAVTLSLPVPKPNTPCQMMPGFISAETRDGRISLKEAAVKKTAGTDSVLRKTIERIFGKI